MSKSKLWDKLREARKPVPPKRPDNAFTTAEYASEMRLGPSAARAQLCKLERAGKLKRVTLPVVYGTSIKPTSGWQLVE